MTPPVVALSHSSSSLFFPGMDQITASTATPATPRELEGGLGLALRSRDDSVSSENSIVTKKDERGGDSPVVHEAGSTSDSAGAEGADGADHLSSWERRVQRTCSSLLPRILSRSPRLAKYVSWTRGPTPPVTTTTLKPFLPRTEAFFDRLFAPIANRRSYLVPLFLAAWFVTFTFLVRLSSFTNLDAQFLGGTATYWSANDGCGLDGSQCLPFDNSTLFFRCPAQVLSIELLNQRAVGTQELIYQTMLVGGMDKLGTYRGDSWICAAAIQQGLFGNGKGGCGNVELVGTFEGYQGGVRNGVESVGFDSTFPLSYRIQNVNQLGCKDLRNDILAFNVAMTFVFSFIVRPKPAMFFWVLFIVGFWHVVLVSNPTGSPPNIELGFQYFLPGLFVAYAFWRFSFRYVVPAFESAVGERTVWYLAGYWIGLLSSISLSWIPISRLTPHDIAQRPGGLVAVICLAIFLFLVIVNQLRVIRSTGWLWFYLKWYAVGGICIALLLTLPGLQFRLHHYIAAIVLMPGLAFVTRPSAFFQGFLLGLFLDGIGRWGFDSILQTFATLVGDGSTGSPLPAFLTNSTTFVTGQTSIFWSAVPSALVTAAGGSWDGFGLIVDDVLRYTGSGTNYSLAGLDPLIPHYFRLAYESSGTAGDFTKAATLFLSNGTWIDGAPGPS